MRVHEAARHRNKLRTGHLKGNRFRLRLRIPRDAFDASLDLVPAVEMALARYDELTRLEGEVGDLTERLAARKLTLEVTESILMTDPARAMEVLAELRGLGVHLALDDFGTGWSSLTHLQRMPVDEIKINR